VNTQLGRKTNQTHEVPSRVTMFILKPQMVYIVPIMTTQANIFVGWPPPIPINCEGKRTKSMVNLQTRVPSHIDKF
jgi:hypothetical protein